MFNLIVRLFSLLKQADDLPALTVHDDDTEHKRVVEALKELVVA
jgi:hypothetical protein